MAPQGAGGEIAPQNGSTKKENCSSCSITERKVFLGAFGVYYFRCFLGQMMVPLQAGGGGGGGGKRLLLSTRVRLPGAPGIQTNVPAIYHNALPPNINSLL